MESASVIDFPIAEPEPTAPNFVSYFKVGALPYKLSRLDALSVINDLLHHGAVEITVKRFIEDVNAPKDCDTEVQSQ